MSPPEDRRVRMKKPKSRTGCGTCKIRRVKCDEQKPACLRCLKFGAHCEGYVTSASSFQEVTPRELVPRANGDRLLVPSTMRLPISTFFKDGQEYMYFLNYQEEASLQLSGPFDTSLWNRIVLRACQSEPSLCRLTSAIGALNRASQFKEPVFREDEASSHEKFALKEYGRALKSIQVMISRPKSQDTARLLLIASLLIFCFENLLGNFEPAMDHMMSALHLMDKQLLLAAGRRYNHIKSESPTASLEDEIVSAFARLDSQLLSRPDNPKTSLIGSEITRTSVLDLTYSTDSFKVPYRFKTISEARCHLEHLQFHALPCMAHEFAVQIGGGQDRINDYALEFCRTHSKQFNLWRVAFAPLYAEACKSKAGKDFVAAATLRVSALSTEITTQRIAIRGYDATGLYEDESREILSLSKLVVADPSFLRRWVFECGIVPGVFIVAVICENLDIKREALQVLRSTVPRREGTWDSVVLLREAERIVGIAEEARQPKF